MRGFFELTTFRVTPLPADDAATDTPAFVPLLLLILGLAGGLQCLMPLGIISDILMIEDIDPIWLDAAGIVFASCGFYVGHSGYATLARGAGANAWQPARVLVTDGVYGWTRNPGYLGLLVGLFGAGLALEFDWLILLIGPFWMFLNYAAVRPEELYLQSEFGEAYEAYVRRVPRYFFIH